MSVKLFYASILISLKAILIALVRRMVKDFIDILSQWKDDIKAAVIVQ